MADKACLRCHRPFELSRKRAALCEGCRIERNRVQTRMRKRTVDESIAMVLNNVLPMLEVDLHQIARGLARDIVNALSGVGDPFGGDRMPDGTRSRQGADEGRSSYLATLRGELDTLSAIACADPWWDENPPEDVFFSLGNDMFYESFIVNKSR